MSKEASARRGPATIQMVADRARVSPKTVSRVINNERGVREETRNRIQEAIRQLDYQPNLNARGLAGARSFLIGLFYDKPGDYLSEFQTGAVQRCGNVTSARHASSCAEACERAQASSVQST